MPCADPYRDQDNHAAGADAAWALAQPRLDALTRMLCDICATLEKYGESHLMDAETRLWWTDHKAHDAKRHAASAHH